MIGLWVAAVACLGGGEVNPLDQPLLQAWQRQDVPVAPICSDEEFLRRVTLDLTGRIPTLDQWRQFTSDPDRPALVRRLLESEEFAQAWSRLWTAMLVGYGDPFGTDAEALRKWLEASLRNDVPFDQVVASMIAARGPSALEGAANFLVRYPDDPAVAVCRQFLGVRLDCARCHDHPLDRWTQEDYRLMARFFQPLRRREVSPRNYVLEDGVPGLREPPPRFLTGARPQTSQWRAELALMVTRSKPFARNLANRLWYLLVGRGIVQPPDDFRADNPPSIPALLDALVEQLRHNEFRIKPVIYLICTSQAYQRSSRGPRTPEAEALFAVKPVKPLTIDQLIDSICTASNLELPPEQRRRLREQWHGDVLDESFSRPWEYQPTVQQILRQLQQDIPVPEGDWETLWVRFLGRMPEEHERRALAGLPAEELVFVLVHSHAFCFND